MIKTININGDALYRTRDDGRITTNRHGGSFKEWPITELMHDLANAIVELDRLKLAVKDMTKMAKDNL